MIKSENIIHTNRIKILFVQTKLLWKLISFIEMEMLLLKSIDLFLDELNMQSA